jgi:sulfur carrier protein ThiS adenylyltransferase
MSCGAFEENIIKKLGKDNFRKVQAARIGIAGAGGLGSNCAQNLVRSGFKKFTIVDFDIIDPSNLDRQFYFHDQVGMSKVAALKTNLIRINPSLDLRMISKKIQKEDVPELFGDCDAVVECLDAAENKRMLVEELMKRGKFTVTASGLGGIGSSDDIKVRKLKESLVMIGDLESDICNKPAISPRVSVAAAKQADVILKFIVSK